MIRKKALIVGIDDYPDGLKLGGCVNDAGALTELLKRNEDGSPNFDVDTPSIKNKGDLKRGIRKLFEGEGDIALFYFSGHGGRENTEGCMVTPDFEKDDLGVPMSYLESNMANSKLKNVIAILDCCHAGKAGDVSFAEDMSVLRDGMTVMSACSRDEYALERAGHGIFTQLIIEGLNGGAADLSGFITPGSLYAYVDKSLGAWSQRPVFKTNVSNFVCLRKVDPQVDSHTLRELTTLFENRDVELQLDPSFEFTNTSDSKSSVKEPYSIKENVQKFKVLQKLEGVGLVIPVNEEHMYFAAMNSGRCKLTALGKYYWSLVEGGRI